MKQFELHPLCTLFPRLGGAEFDALKADIAANGLRHPIVLHDGMILDGGNRYRACVEAGIEPKTVKFDGTNIVSFVLSANLHRRHLSAGQQAAIVASAQDWGKAHVAGSNQHTPKSDGPVTLPDHASNLNTVADRAAQSGASERTQRMADKVAKSAPDLAKRVAHGELSLPAALKSISPSAVESASEILERTAAVASRARKPAPDAAALDSAITERDEARESAAYLAEDLAEVRAELDAYRAAELGEGEQRLAAANKRILQLEQQVRSLEDRRDGLMNENAELKREVKRLRRGLGQVANG